MKTLLESINFTLDQINNPRYIYKDVYQEMVDIQLNYNSQYCPIIFEDNSIDYDTECLYETLDMIFESELSDSDKVSYLNIIVEKTLGQKINNFVANKGIQKHFNSLSGKQSGFGGKVFNNLKNRLIDTHKVVNDTNDGPKTKKDWAKAVVHDFVGVHKKQGLYDQKYKDHIKPMNKNIKDTLKISHIMNRSVKNSNYLAKVFEKNANKLKSAGHHLGDKYQEISDNHKKNAILHQKIADLSYNMSKGAANIDEYKNRLEKAKQIYWEKNNTKPDIIGKVNKK